MPTFRAFDKQQVSSEPLQSRTHHKMKVIVTSNYIMNNDERYFTHLKCFFCSTIDHRPWTAIQQVRPFISLSIFSYSILLGFWYTVLLQPWLPVKQSPPALVLGDRCTRRMEPPTRLRDLNLAILHRFFCHISK